VNAAATATTGSRPRVAGAREQEILAAALDVLHEQGYDRLTLDTVATRARASKATLYRRWSSKADLVAEAMASMDGGTLEQIPDTGSLRGDLLVMAAGHGGLLDPARADLMCSVATAMGRDVEFGAALRSRFLAPRQRCLMQLFERARDRGEIRHDVDLELMSTIFPAMMLFRMTMGEMTCPAADLVVQIVDEIVLPAMRPHPARQLDSG
jgi:AcrR family transcriptional regulator